MKKIVIPRAASHLDEVAANGGNSRVAANSSANKFNTGGAPLRNDTATKNSTGGTNTVSTGGSSNYSTGSNHYSGGSSGGSSSGSSRTTTTYYKGLDGKTYTSLAAKQNADAAYNAKIMAEAAAKAQAEAEAKARAEAAERARQAEIERARVEAERAQQLKNQQATKQNAIAAQRQTLMGTSAVPKQDQQQRQQQNYARAMSLTQQRAAAGKHNGSQSKDDQYNYQPNAIEKLFGIFPAYGATATPSTASETNVKVLGNTGLGSNPTTLDRYKASTQGTGFNGNSGAWVNPTAVYPGGIVNNDGSITLTPDQPSGKKSTASETQVSIYSPKTTGMSRPAWYTPNRPEANPSQSNNLYSEAMAVRQGAPKPDMSGFNYSNVIDPGMPLSYTQSYLSNVLGPVSKPESPVKPVDEKKYAGAGGVKGSGADSGSGWDQDGPTERDPYMDRDKYGLYNTIKGDSETAYDNGLADLTNYLNQAIAGVGAAGDQGIRDLSNANANSTFNMIQALRSALGSGFTSDEMLGGLLASAVQGVTGLGDTMNTNLNDYWSKVIQMKTDLEKQRANLPSNASDIAQQILQNAANAEAQLRYGTYYGDSAAAMDDATQKYMQQRNFDMIKQGYKI